MSDTYRRKLEKKVGKIFVIQCKEPETRQV